MKVNCILSSLLQKTTQVNLLTLSKSCQNYTSKGCYSLMYSLAQLIKGIERIIVVCVSVESTLWQNVTSLPDLYFKSIPVERASILDFKNSLLYKLSSNNISEPWFLHLEMEMTTIFHLSNSHDCYKDQISNVKALLNSEVLYSS